MKSKNIVSNHMRIAAGVSEMTSYQYLGIRLRLVDLSTYIYINYLTYITEKYIY